MISLFTEDSLTDYGPDLAPMSGKSEFGPMIERGLTNLFAATSHRVSNIAIRVDDRDAAFF